jgi:AcrR family transcriptional regulator
LNPAFGADSFLITAMVFMSNSPVFAHDLESLTRSRIISAPEPRAKVSTKDRILNATEMLFIQRGFDGTSLRAITTDAAVNLAAVNYHFGSKEELFALVLTRRLDVLNTERLRRLDSLEASGPDATHGAEQIIGTLFLPALALARDAQHGGEDFLRLLGRAYADPAPFVRSLLGERYAATNARFKAAFARALPGLTSEDLSMRLHFILDSVAASLAADDVRRHLSALKVGAQTSAQDDVQFLGYLAPFLAAGLRATVRQPQQLRALEALC